MGDDTINKNTRKDNMKKKFAQRDKRFSLCLHEEELQDELLAYSPLTLWSRELLYGAITKLAWPSRILFRMMRMLSTQANLI